MLSGDQGDKISNHRQLYLEKEDQKKQINDAFIQKGVIDHQRTDMAKALLDEQKKELAINRYKNDISSTYKAIQEQVKSDNTEKLLYLREMARQRELENIRTQRERNYLDMNKKMDQKQYAEILQKQVKKIEKFQNI